MPSLTPASKPPRNPSAFHVATSSTPRSPAQDASVLSSFAHSAAARYLSHAPSPSFSSSSSSASPDPRSLAHQLDLIESLSSPSGVPPPELKRLAGALSRSSYADLLEERHAAGRCAYPGCGHPARQAYVAPGERRREPRALRVRMRANGLFDAREGEGGEGDEAGRFCGARCAARSAFLEGQVGRAGRGAAAAVELLEDVEGRREGVRRSTQELLAAQAASAGASAQDGDAQDGDAQDEGNGDGKGKGKERFREDLLSSLTIHEKPTPSAPPAAPSLANPAPDFERRTDAQAQDRGTSSRFPRAPAPRDGGPGAGGGGGAALLPFETARLARTVLSTLPAPPPPRPPRQQQQQQQEEGSRLPPIRFVTGPRMVDERTGALVEWAGVGADGEDEGVSDEVRAWIDEGIRERDSARGRGEIE